MKMSLLINGNPITIEIMALADEQGGMTPAEESQLRQRVVEQAQELLRLEKMVDDGTTQLEELMNVRDDQKTMLTHANEQINELRNERSALRGRIAELERHLAHATKTREPAELLLKPIPAETTPERRQRVSAESLASVVDEVMSMVVPKLARPKALGLLTEADAARDLTMRKTVAMKALRLPDIYPRHEGLDNGLLPAGLWRVAAAQWERVDADHWHKLVAAGGWVITWSTNELVVYVPDCEEAAQ